MMITISSDGAEDRRNSWRSEEIDLKNGNRSKDRVQNQCGKSLQKLLGSFVLCLKKRCIL